MNGKIELADDERALVLEALRKIAREGNNDAWRVLDWIAAAPRLVLIGLTLETARNI